MIRRLGNICIYVGAQLRCANSEWRSTDTVRAAQLRSYRKTVTTVLLNIGRVNNATLPGNAAVDSSTPVAPARAPAAWREAAPDTQCVQPQPVMAMTFCMIVCS